MADRTFRSDNNAGICPEALEAVVAANDGSHRIGYGDDAYTADAVTSFRGIFGAEAAVYFVATGTAANTLAIAALTQPWQRIICHEHSHLNEDESTAPERLAQVRLTPVPMHPATSKLTAADIERYGRNTRGDVHQPAPGMVSVSNPTEFGEVYSAVEMNTLCEAAHAFGYRVHVDGARFANAVASLACDPKAIACDAGVDALSFGGTKNGLAFGEAVLFFPQGDGRDYERAVTAFPFHRKASGHLLSKHRFVSAPFAATLQDDVWLRHARHANTMAAELAKGIESCGIEIRFDVDSNAVFGTLPPDLDHAMRQRGHECYMFGDQSWNLARLVCSFDTHPNEIESFVNDLNELCL